MEMTETRKFTVSPHIIFSLIKAQAGTLGKAITECVMNSVDAQATRVDINLTGTSVRITDDGAGFQTRDEIEAWFETLGFDHSDEANHRAFGSFGIGRAQLWSFASTVWRTHRFVMDVDIKNKGLDYELNEYGSPTPGLVIDGSFYAALTPGALVAIEQELRGLIKYVEIPVFLNGKNLCQDPSKETWDLETPEAWFRFDQTRRSQLTVYNMGVFVKGYWFNQYNVGGTVVTKPNVKLELNMSRNDVLVTECKHWAKISKVLAANSVVVKSAPPKEKATEAEMEGRAAKLLTSEDYSALSELAFTDIRGRARDLRSLVYSGMRICFADSKDEKAKRAHSSKLAFVLKTETLSRFGVTTASGLKEVLESAKGIKDSGWALRLEKVEFFDTLAEALPTLDDQYDVVLDKDLEPVEKALLRALSIAVKFVARFAAPTLVGGSVRAGVSDKAKSWCFAGDTLLDRRLLKEGVASFEGFATLASRAVHEMVGGMADSNFEHDHDIAFYKAFHDLMLDPKVILQYRYGYSHFARECSAKSIDLPAKTLAAIADIL